MGYRYRLGDFALLAVQILAGWRAWRNYRALPALSNARNVDPGHVSIVIPARNEAESLPELLDSLTQLTYADHDVLVVDDGSHDGTGGVAWSHDARVLRIEGPQMGWTGKNFACWTGAGSTHGEWILFTDADTVHGPQSLDRALSMATEFDAGLLSLLARQRCRTFWERLLLPYAYALYFAGASRVNRPGGSAVANGQYMLFRRSAYERIGGHAAVRGSIIEDVSLARLAESRGIRVVLARAENHLAVRMYRDLRDIWEGFGKNAVRFVAQSPRTGILTVLAGVAYASGLPVGLRRRPWALRLAMLLAPACGLASWYRRFGVPMSFTLLYPLAATVFQLIALDSIRRTATGGGTVWKGRRY